MATSTDQASFRGGYLFSNADPQAAVVLRLLAQICDRHSADMLREVGLRAGQRWLDAGAGLGSVSHLLADAVGPGGHVTAVDIDPRHIRPADNLTIRTGDIRAAELPAASLDGIHVRLLTMHLPDPVDVLARLAAALADDGVLVVSEWDCQWRDLVRASPDSASTELVTRFVEVSLAVAEQAGVDLGWATRVLSAMVEVGLVDVSTRTESRSWSGGTGICLLHRANSIARADLLMQAGLSAAELNRFQDLMLDPRLVLSGWLMHTTVGYRR